MSSFYVEIEKALFICSSNLTVVDFNNYSAVFLLDAKQTQGLFNVSGKLNYGRFANSGFIQPFSHIIDNRVITFTGNIYEVTVANLNNSRRYLATLLGREIVAKITFFDEDNFDETKETFWTDGILENMNEVQIISENVQGIGLTMFCLSPYFYQYTSLDGNGLPIPTTLTKQITKSGYRFSFRYPKVYQNEFGNLTINITGNTVVYPIIELKNLSQNWVITGSQAPGFAFYGDYVSENETIVIDTLNSTVVSSTGQNKNQYLTGLENLILYPGENVIKTDISQFNNNTQIVYKYYNTYLNL